MSEYKSGNLYYDVPEKNYYDHDALSNSDLKLISESPKDWIEGIRETTRAMEEGKAFHAYMLEREKFAKSYAVAPLVSDVDKKTGEIIIKEVRFDERTAEYKALAEKHAGKQLMKHGDFQKLFWTKQALKTDINAQAILSLPGRSEVSGFFDYEGIPCRFRADWLCKKGNMWIIADLKKVATRSGTYLTQDTIERYNRTYGCVQQAAFYRHGVRTIMGTDNVIFVNIYLEMNEAKTSSLGCVAAVIPEDLLIGERGEGAFHDAILDYKRYQVDGWPSHAQHIANKQIEMGIIKGGIPSIGIGGWI